MFIVLLHLCAHAQPPVLAYDFNDGRIEENDRRVTVRAPGVTLASDRFGNPNSAVFIQGHQTCYLNLGVSPLLKSSDISISMWLYLDTRVYTGKGYDYNPILITKNGPGTDFINALNISLDGYSKKLSGNSTRDSTMEAIVVSKDTVQYQKWYHLVLVCNNEYLAFYEDGRLQARVAKGFVTPFLATDSMVIGHSTNTKNVRFMRGVVDDIRVYHRPLSEDDIEALYNEPNPNRVKRMLAEAMKYLIVIAGLVAVIIVLLIRNKRALRKQAEALELANRMSDLELKAIKAQMNPHFVSNCLAAIQELNYHHEREKAGQYIAKFSHYLRQVLNFSDENYIPVAQEIELIRLFIELEQLRFSNGFDFNLEVEASVDINNTLVPSLITQPFIENAIWHGLLPLEGKRRPKLDVRFLKRNGYPLIEIEDNGVGRDPNALPKPRSKGTRLIEDKIDTLNRLSHSSKFKLSILDLKDDQGHPAGTKVIIFLDNITE